MFHRSKADEEQSADMPLQNNMGEKTETRSIENIVSNKTESKSEEKAMTSAKDQETQSPSIDIPAGNASFPQRPVPAQAPRYPGAYASAASENNGEERKLQIGSGITMSGEIDSCDVLVVEGTVEASLKGARMLEIAESGVFYGAVEIDEAMISGRFEGEIMVNGRLTITATGSVTGSIVYKEMAMEAGAIIDGKLSPLSSNADTKTEKPRAKKMMKAAMPAKNDNQGNELPLAAASS